VTGARVFGVVFVAGLVQAVLVSSLLVGGGAPDVLLLVVISVGLLRGSVPGALAGFLGGLVMSAIKRDRGVKDWGHLVEGHGGVLDRLDSVVFAAPIFFHLTRYFLTL